MTHPTPDPLDDLVAEALSHLPNRPHLTWTQAETVIRRALLADRQRQAERIAELEAIVREVAGPPYGMFQEPFNLRDSVGDINGLLRQRARAALADRPAP